MEPLTTEEIDSFDKLTRCHICSEIFLPIDFKIKDHNHLTGKYKEPAHNFCNINYKDEKHVPVLFDNLSGYDAHFIIKKLSTEINCTMNLLPVKKEQYISFIKYTEITKISFRFIDSYRFMNEKLEVLSSLLDPN